MTLRRVICFLVTVTMTSTVAYDHFTSFFFKTVLRIAIVALSLSPQTTELPVSFQHDYGQEKHRTKRD